MSATDGNNSKSKLTKDEAKELAEMYKSLLNAYGQFAEALGKIQQNHEDSFAAMFSIEAAAGLPEMLSQLSDKKPELGKLLTGMFIKLAAFLPRMRNLMNLSAKEKIQLGENLRSLAKDFDELLIWVEKVEK